MAGMALSRCSVREPTESSFMFGPEQAAMTNTRNAEIERQVGGRAEETTSLIRSMPTT